MAGDYAINEAILKGLKGHCNNDEVMWNLLRELVYEVANQEGRQWKDLFKRKITAAIEEAGDTCEDR